MTYDARLRVTAILAFCIVGTSLPAQRVDPERGESGTRRFAADSFWTVNWSRGYENEEDLFIEPRAVAFTRGAVVVVDQGSREVLAFNPATGKLLLQMKARAGGGPGEIRRPHAAIPVPEGFAVVDAGNARLSAFDVRGRLVWDMPLPEPMVGGICAQSHSRISIKRYSSNVVELRDTSGALVARRTLPWGANATETLSHGVQVAGPSAGGWCAFIREFGGQFALLSPQGSLKTFSYVEKLAEPVVQSSSQVLEKGETGTVRQTTSATASRQSGIHAMIRGDTLMVRFGGETNRRLRLLDYYSISTGKYLHSRMLPGHLVTLTVGPDGTFYGTEIGNEYSGLVAMRPSRTPPPPEPKAKAK